MMMNFTKKLTLLFILLVAIFLTSGFADAAVRVRGYFRKDGTYVQPHYRSNPDGNPYNNYSYPGNTNPYTGVTSPGGSTFSASGTFVPSTGIVLGVTNTPIPGFESVFGTMHHSKINALFRHVYDGRNPTVSENTYWLKRLVDKPLVGDMLGAMQWHRTHQIQH